MGHLVTEPSEWVQPDDAWIQQPGVVSGRMRGLVYISRSIFGDAFLTNFYPYTENAGPWNVSGIGNSLLSSGVSYSTIHPDGIPNWYTTMANLTGVATATTWPRLGTPPGEVPPNATVEYEEEQGEYLGSWRARVSVNSVSGAGHPARGTVRGCRILGFDQSAGYPGRDAVMAGQLLTATPGNVASTTVALSPDQTIGWFSLTERQWDLEPPPIDGTRADYGETAQINLLIEGLYRPPRRRYVYDPVVMGQWYLQQRQHPAGNAGGWPLSQRHHGGVTGSWPLSQR